MSFVLLSVAQVETLHDLVLNPGELAGKALDKSLEGALARVENRLAYGMIAHAFDLAAAYAEAILHGHCFNDAIKRTAYRVMIVCLHLHRITLRLGPQDIGDQIIALALRRIAAPDLADWLRARV